MVRDTFLSWLKEKKAVNFSKDDYFEEHLWEMWNYSKTVFKKNKSDIDFDPDNFMDLIKKIIEEKFPLSKGLRVDIFIYESIAVSGDSEMWVCYSNDPANVFTELERIIKEFLHKGIH